MSDGQATLNNSDGILQRVVVRQNDMTDMDAIADLLRETTYHEPYTREWQEAIDRAGDFLERYRVRRLAHLKAQARAWADGSR